MKWPLRKGIRIFHHCNEPVSDGSKAGAGGVGRLGESAGKEILFEYSQGLTQNNSSGV